MCGIIGYVGKQPAAKILLDGLEKLEYRGYDSAGIALCQNDSFFVLKTDKRIEELSRLYENGEKSNGVAGIGHTRWATHGEPSVKNAHPHLSSDKKIAVVHNGIIENYVYLRKKLEEEGFAFSSDTDSEVVPNLVSKYYNGDLLKAVATAIKELEGSYALGIMVADEPEKIVAVKQFSPLLVGLGETENYIASDVTAFIKGTNKVIYPLDRELVVLTADGVNIYSSDQTLLERQATTVNWDISSAEKSGFDHFMLKEIMEQPKVLEDTIESRITGGKICFDEIELPKEKLKKLKKINIVACGSAYHAGVAAKYVLERLTQLPTDTEFASEFRYRNPLTDENTLTIVISQSGETADTLAALKEAKKSGSYVLAVVNVVGSSIANESDGVLYTRAGPEISVATTKGYTTQVALLYLFAIWLADKLCSVNSSLLKELLSELRAIPQAVKEALAVKEEIKELAKGLVQKNSVFFIGRNVDYAVALEASLKLKEISYIHSEAYAAGELKHGTISLIEEDTPVVALAAFEPLGQKLLSNIKEVKARGANVISFTTKGNDDIVKASDKTVFVPSVHELFCALPEIVPLQLYAYYVSCYKGLDVDKPRNLAKSVTVE